jgi:hypothetical protein
MMDSRTTETANNRDGFATSSSSSFGEEGQLKVSTVHVLDPTDKRCEMIDEDTVSAVRPSEDRHLLPRIQINILSQVRALLLRPRVIFFTAFASGCICMTT